MEDKKSSFILIAMVAIVAIVALVVLVLNVGEKRAVVTTEKESLGELVAKGGIVKGPVFDTNCTPVCNDSDNGFDIFSFGIVTKTSSACTVSYYNDYCVGNYTLKEYYCSGTSVASNITSCPAGYICLNGACHYNATIECYNNYDCGPSYNSTYCSGNKSCTHIVNSYCANPGTPSSYCYNETNTTCVNCEYGCNYSTGLCNDYTRYCYDSDGGFNYNVSGYANSSSGILFDYCQTNKLLAEAYCTVDLMPDYYFYNCTYNCSSGRCS